MHRIRLAIICLAIISIFATTRLTAQVTSFEIDDSRFNKELKHILDSIYDEDQSIRNAYIALMQRQAPKEELEAAILKMKRSDSLNLELVTLILDEHGFQDPQDVGMTASQGLFLVIQHADLEIQRKYFSMLQQAEKDGKLLSSNFAIFLDRVYMREGKDQLYGSQGFKDKTTGKQYIYPIADVDQLDERRKAMALPPMAQYAAGWNLEAYKQQLPTIREAAKQLFTP